MLELRLEAIAELVGEEAGGMKTLCKPRFDLVERAHHLLGRVGRNDALGIGIEQAAAALRQAVVKQNTRGNAHLERPITPNCLTEAA